MCKTDVWETTMNAVAIVRTHIKLICYIYRYVRPMRIDFNTVFAIADHPENGND